MSEPSLEAVIVEFLEAEENGRPVDRAALLARCPSSADELRSFFEDHDRMASAVHQEVVAAGVGEAPTLDKNVQQNAVVSPFDLTGPLPENSQFGEFELLEEIARGGMGVVFRARQLRLNRVVALKMILSGPLADESAVKRFYSEAEAAAQLNHTGIVPIHEVGQCGGLHYYTMSYIDGRSLAEILHDCGPLDPLQSAQILKQVAHAVSYAHDHRVIHRDLKPGNILIDTHGEPRITDFGLAKRLDAGQELTASGQILGTLQYMPPEQAMGRTHGADVTADIYSLGAVLYACLTGRPPFEAANHVDLLLNVLETEPVPPRRLDPRIPRELERICLRCLEKDPRRRYRSAAELAVDLDLFLRGEPLLTASTNRWDVVRRWPRRYPALCAHVGALVLIEVIRQAKIIFAGFDNVDWAYHVQFTGIIALLAALCFCFQVLLLRNDVWSSVTRYVWAGCDVAFLTWSLLLARGPLGLLFPVYALLIVGSVSFFRVRLVSFMTVACLASYGLVLAIRPDQAQPPHYAFVGGATILLIGVIMGLHVRRMRILSQYYDRGQSAR